MAVSNLFSHKKNGYSSPEKCRFCMGTGTVTVELGGNEKEVSRCINCEGAGSLTCTTCQGSGIQPRYLDRRYGVV
jgi:DnaJ-class molecular chaperone